MSEHKKYTILLLSSLRDKKLQVSKKLSFSSTKKIQAEGRFFFCQKRLYFHQIYIPFLFALLSSTLTLQVLQNHPVKYLQRM